MLKEIQASLVLQISDNNSEELDLFSDLPHALNVCFLVLVIKNDEDDWCLWVLLKIVIEVVRSVVHVKTLAMSVGQLLNLQSTFFGYDLTYSIADQEDVL